MALPAGLPPMATGLFGYLGYDMARQVEDLPNPPPDTLGLPDAILLRPTITAIFDGVKDEIIVISPVWIDKTVDAKALAAQDGFELGSVRSYFKANSKALAELEGEGLMKLLFNKATGEVLGAHIYGLHAADLIQEIANAVARRQSVKQLVNEVHTHPTLSEVVEVAYKQAVQQVAA